MLRRCSKCTVPCKEYAYKAQSSKELQEISEKQDQKILEIIDSLKERQKRTILRKITAGEIEFDPKREVLVYAEGGKDFDLGGDKEEDSDEERKSGEED